MTDIATPIRNCATEMNIIIAFSSLGTNRGPINIVNEDANAKENAHTKCER